MDNANDATLDLLEFLPTVSTCDILVATRISGYSLHPSQSSLVVSKPNLEQASAMLLSVCPNSKHDVETVNELVSELDFHPLCLIQAGSYISQTDITIPVYLTKYRVYHQAMVSQPSMRDLDATSAKVLATFQLSYQRLTQGAAQLLLLFPYLSMQPLPVSVLSRASLAVHQLSVRSLIAPHTETQELLSRLLLFFTNKKAGWSTHKFGLVARQLVSYSLIEMTSEGNGGDELSIHPMLHELLRKTRLLETPMKTVATHLVALACPDWTETSLPPLLRAKVLFHVNEYCQQGLDCDPLAAARLAVLLHSARYLNEQCRLEEWIADQRERLRGFEHVDTLVANANLAITYSDLKQFTKAAAIQKRVLEAQVRILGRESNNVRLSVIGLVATYVAQKDLQSAEAFLESEITQWSDHAQKDRIFSQLFVEMRTVAEGYNQLARYADAVRLFSRLIELELAFPGSADTKQALSDQHSLAVSLYNDSRYREAETLLHTVTEGRKRTLGEDHLDTLHSSSLLAQTYYMLEKNEDAERLAESVLDARKRLLKAGHRDIASSIRLFAQVKQTNGGYHEALSLMQELLEEEISRHGKESQEALKTMGYLGRRLYRRDFFQEAADLFQKVIEHRKHTLGDGDRETELDNLHDPMLRLAKCYCGLGRWKDAELLIQEVLESRQKRLGRFHLDTLGALSALVRPCRGDSLCESQSFFEGLFSRGCWSLHSFPHYATRSSHWKA